MDNPEIPINPLKSINMVSINLCPITLPSNNTLLDMAEVMVEDMPLVTEEDMPVVMEQEKSITISKSQQTGI